MSSANEIVQLSVIMPFYNEADIISNSIRKTIEVLDSSRISYEIILVDDGSLDHGMEKIDGFNGRISILRYSQNKGKGFALRFGASRCRGEVIAFYDSDLNIDPHHLVDYFNCLNDTGVDVIVGSKRVKGSSVNVPLRRKLLSISYHIFARVLLGLKVMDTQVGIKLFKGPVLKDIVPILTIDGYALDVELLTLISMAGFKIKERPVTINIDQSQSKICLRSVGKMFIDTFKVLYRTKFRDYPKENFTRGELPSD